jgi:hypothetical protein
MRATEDIAWRRFGPVIFGEMLWEVPLVALHLDPFEHEPIRQQEGTVRVADIRPHWRVANDGIEVLAHGALVCPDCDAPVVIAGKTAAWRELSCGFCGHRARAREFLARDVFDTVANEAYLVARVQGI